MNKLYKEKWIEALRSGEYEQAKGLLKKPSGYCCLGVLCDVVRKTHKKKGFTWDDTEFASCFKGHSSTLPAEVKYLTKVDWEVTGTLMGMNDDQNKSFVEISNWIEENL